MKKATLLVFFSLFFAFNLSAATVEVKWVEPDKYADIHEGEDFKASYRERLFYNLDKHFAKLAEKLPKDQLLKIEVLNVDLAGDINWGGINLIRLIEDRYPPRMTLRYTLLASGKQVVKSAEVKLKDYSFMTRGALRYKHDTWGYEKQMLDDWFKKTFIKPQKTNA